MATVRMRLGLPTPILRAAATSRIKWSETLNLPRSTFPARASAEELRKYRRRCADELYARQRESRKGPDWKEFVLHDGPPYANGAVHAGHALNKILKDLILRWQMATGKRVAYRPGWDCHGLPIELKALQQARTQREEARTLEDAPGLEADAAGTGMSAQEIRSRAKKLAEETIDLQRESFRDWGVLGEWEQPYRTMDRDFEIKQLGVFREMVKKGLISRHHRPVHWSPSSRTALAEAELEYDDNHRCTAAFVKMPFARVPEVFKSIPGLESGPISALIWTTTPWTLPANKAIAVKDDIEYLVIKIFNSAFAEFLIVAKDRLEHVLSYLPEGYSHQIVCESVTGAQLANPGAACFNIFQGTLSPVLSADFVTATSGTGLVHMAPGHGMEDYQVCQKNGVGPAFAPVDEAGRFTADVFPSSTHGSSLAGLDAQVDGVKAVLEALDSPASYLPPNVPASGTSLVFAKHSFTHKNPIDWRTKQPVITRATAQWFADVSAIQHRARTSLDNVKCIPPSGKTRLDSFLSGRSQWCISRQRSWGVPIPALYHKETGEVCISDQSIAHIISVLQSGSRTIDNWFNDTEADSVWLHPSLEPGKWVRGKDTMDVWFDSGTSWTTLENQTKQPLTDAYVEGTDQHRGWFQSSLLTHIAVQDSSDRPRSPYGTLITHGFILDAEGRKMSKSLGNVIAPKQIVDGSLLPPMKPKKQKGKANTGNLDPAKSHYDSMGPDVLRLWVASSDYTRDVSITVQQLQEIQQTLQKYRVTFKWLLGVLGDKPCADVEPTVIGHALTFADRAILYRLEQVAAAVYEAYSRYEFHRGVKEINTFVNNDLSAFYFEIVKDGLYTGSEAVRHRTQYVLSSVLDGLMKYLGPITPHLVEEVWEHMPAATRPRVHPLGVVLECPRQGFEASERLGEIEVALRHFGQLSAAVKLAQEEARRAGHLRSGLACKVHIHLPTNEESELAKHILKWQAAGELADLLVVSQVKVGKGHDLIERAISNWKHEQQVDVGIEDAGSQCKVVVLAPDGDKCPRCWKMTAEDPAEPCHRCRDVLEEKGIH